MPGDFPEPETNVHRREFRFFAPNQGNGLHHFRQMPLQINIELAPNRIQRGAIRAKLPGVSPENVDDLVINLFRVSKTSGGKPKSDPSFGRQKPIVVDLPGERERSQPTAIVKKTAPAMIPRSTNRHNQKQSLDQLRVAFSQ